MQFLTRAGYIIIAILAVVVGFKYIEFRQNSTSYFVNAQIYQDEFASPEIASERTENKIYSAYEFNAKTSSFDKRVYVLDQYFLANKSPLYGTAKLFVEACDNIGAPRDCITVVAIAQNETHLCKYYNSAETHNCWGFGGPQGYRRTFDSFKESINKVTDVLVNQYGLEYMIDPSLMERTFCGRQAECIGWGNGIKSIMRTIDKFSQNLGMGSLIDLR